MMSAAEFRYPATKSAWVNVGSLLPRQWRRIAERLIDAYVLARCPVILFVDAHTLHSDYPRGEGHAVVIVGVRHAVAAERARFPTVGESAEFCPELLSDLIVHDPGFQPYFVIPTDMCFYASAQYCERKAGRPEGCINLVFVATQKIAVHAIDCLQSLLDPRIGPRGRGEAHAICQYATGNDQRDMRFSLVHRNDVAETFFKCKAAFTSRN